MGEVVQLRKPAVAVGGPIVKVALVMFVLVELACFAYGVFFAAFSMGPLTQFLQDAHVADALTIEGHLLQFAAAPLAYVIITAISPLIGWWVYSRIESGGQAKVMWGAAALFAVTFILFGLTLGGMLMAVNPVLLLIGTAILVLYTWFCMGLGFLPAQIFKVKL